MTDFAEEVWDEDGYPTDAFLEHVRTWHYARGHDDLLEFAMTGHIYPDCWSREHDGGKAIWEISTGGWSGNESIICALMENQMFWAMCWQQSRRGGHYIFHIKYDGAKP